MRREAGVVIVGAGAAGTSAATELRRLGYDGPLTLLNGEPTPPYNRTAVNKGLLQGTMEFESVRLPTPDDDAIVVDVVRASAVDTDARTVTLENGDELRYTTLVVASGSRPRTMQIPLADHAASHAITLRTAADAAHLRARLDDAAKRRARLPVRVAVLGAGLIGAETAEALASDGHDVTLVDSCSLPLERIVGPTVAQWIRDQHRAHLHSRIGVDVRTISSAADAFSVTLSSGETVPADIVLVAVGVVPDLAWLQGTAMDTTDGVLVDDRLRATGVRHVYAAGDVALIRGSRSPGRLEHWGHAMSQGTHAARVIAHDLGLADDPGSFDAPRSFSTRLYGKAISVLGAYDPSRCETLLSGDATGEEFVVVAPDEDRRISSAVVVGKVKTANKLRPLLARGATIDEVAELLGAMTGAR